MPSKHLFIQTVLSQKGKERKGKERKGISEDDDQNQS
jgi:hypothetical protein